MYFSVLKKLNWVAPSGESEDSGIQDNYSAAPNRIYYRLTEAGKTAADELWSNPLFTLYPENGANHKKKSEY
jgi:DNA-binding PadR family transcriptional regulator